MNGGFTTSVSLEVFHRLHKFKRTFKRNGFLIEGSAGSFYQRFFKIKSSCLVNLPNLAKCLIFTLDTRNRVLKIPRYVKINEK